MFFHLPSALVWWNNLIELDYRENFKNYKESKLQNPYSGLSELKGCNFRIGRCFKPVLPFLQPRPENYVY